MAYTIPFEFLGLTVSGDLADVTIYTDRFGHKVAFPRSPPKEPPTARQLVQRNRFRSAVAAYMALTDAEKAAYESITLKSGCCLTGQNLFIKVALKWEFNALNTLRRQTGIAVPSPPKL